MAELIYLLRSSRHLDWVQVESKLSKFRTRAVSTVVLIGSFIACVLAGHVPLMFMIFGIQVGTYSSVHMPYRCHLPLI